MKPPRQEGSFLEAAGCVLHAALIFVFVHVFGHVRCVLARKAKSIYPCGLTVLVLVFLFCYSCFLVCVLGRDLPLPWLLAPLPLSPGSCPSVGWLSQHAGIYSGTSNPPKPLLLPPFSHSPADWALCESAVIMSNSCPSRSMFRVPDSWAKGLQLQLLLPLTQFDLWH